MRVIPKTVTEPTTEPVTLAQLRGQVRVDDNADDAMLLGYLIAARTHVENLLGRPIVPRTMRATFERWPVGSRTDDKIDIGVPATSVDAITYTDATQTVVPWTGFIARGDAGCVTHVRPAYNNDWPVLGNDPLITLDITSGFTTMPEPVAQAVIMLAAHFYMNREDVVSGMRVSAVQIPRGVSELLAPYRWRWFG